MVGGASSVLQGGKFGHGFAAAGAKLAFAPGIDNIETGGAPMRIAVAAIVGGTISEATGGKFVNGAVTGAFSRAFNDDGEHPTPEDIAKGVESLNGISNLSIEETKIVLSLLTEMASSDDGKKMMSTSSFYEGYEIIGTKGVTEVRHLEKGAILYLNMNNGFIEGQQGSKLKYELLSVLAHELGHVASPPSNLDSDITTPFKKIYEDRNINMYENPIIKQLRPNWELRKEWGGKYENDKN